jgi:hypothetical protein
MWHYPNPWEHQGGGCAVGQGIAMMGRDPSAPCDDHYKETDTGEDAYLDTTMEAHFAMPEAVEDLGEVLHQPGVTPQANPRAAWVSWVMIAAVATVGIAAGAGIAYAATQRGKRKAEAQLEQAAEQAIASLGTGRDLMTLTDAAYRAAAPACPRPLDPGDPTHADCIRVWLRLRDLVAARLPPPVIQAPEPQEGLADTGPAADMRGWLESLTPKQRTELRATIGPEYYDPISNAAQAGDDKGVAKSVKALQKAIEKHASDEPLAALRQYRKLKSSLGPRLDELMQLAQQHQ